MLVVRGPDALGIGRCVRQAPADQEVPFVAKEPEASVQPGPERERTGQAGHVDKGHRPPDVHRCQTARCDVAP